MNKIIFIVVIMAATPIIYKFTDLLPNNTFGCWATTNNAKDQYVEFTPEQVELIVERTDAQIIQVEIN